MKNKFPYFISDEVVPIFFAGLGLIMIFMLYVMTGLINPFRFIYEFIFFLFREPIIFMAAYLWTKAVIVDVVRIKRKEKMRIMLQPYIIYGLTFFTFWIINDNISRPIMEYAKPSKLEMFLYYDHPSILWIILEIITSLFFIPFQKLTHALKRVEDVLMIDFVRTYIYFTIFGIINFIVKIVTINN